MNELIVKISNGNFELHANGMLERVALVGIVGGVLVALAWIYTRRPR